MTSDDVVWWTYILGYMWFWRYHVGFIIDDFKSSYRDADGEDLIFGLVLGTMACAFWPATAGARGLYVGWTKYGVTHVDSMVSLFPAPKKIETRAEKQARKAREDREQITARRREINDHERSNGLALTRWDA